MFGRHRAMIAVVTTAVVVLGVGQGASAPLQPKSPAASPTPTGPSPARGSTVLASAADAFGGMSDSSEFPQISGDGNWAVFDSFSYGCPSDCTYQPPDPLTANSDEDRVFARNLDPTAASQHRTVQVSLGNSTAATEPVGTIVAPDGTDPNSYSDQASISSDGRYVSFLTGRPTSPRSTTDPASRSSSATVIPTRTATTTRLFRPRTQAPRRMRRRATTGAARSSLRQAVPERSTSRTHRGCRRTGR